MSKAEAGLTPYIDSTVSIITSDGRSIIGTLRGFDQACNLILDECFERVYSSKSGVETIMLGLYVVRGDNVAVVGEVDEERDEALDLAGTRAAPLKAVAH